MPIRADLRHFYGREWRLVVRPRILARAGHCCEQCGKPNHAVVETHTGRSMAILGSGGLSVMFWRDAAGWRNWEGTPLLAVHMFGRTKRVIRVVLTIAHLNHVAGDDRDENLKALCQWCHLHYDQEHHHETRAARKDAGRPLLEAASL